MSYHAPVPFTQKWVQGRSRQVFSCFRCETAIKPEEARIKAKRNAYECYHNECFREEYGADAYNAVAEKPV